MCNVSVEGKNAAYCNSFSDLFCQVTLVKMVNEATANIPGWDDGRWDEGRTCKVQSNFWDVSIIQNHERGHIDKYTMMRCMFLRKMLKMEENDHRLAAKTVFEIKCAISACEINSHTQIKDSSLLIFFLILFSFPFYFHPSFCSTLLLVPTFVLHVKFYLQS